MSPAKLRALKVMGVLLVLVAAVAGLAQTGALAVKTLNVAGNSHLSQNEVMALASVPMGRAMVSINEGIVERRLEGHPWIAHAAVNRNWPSTVEITVEERRPVAVVQTKDGRWAQVADGGVVLSVEPAPANGFPILLDESIDPVPGARVSPEASTLVTLVQQFPDSLRPKVIQIQMDDQGNVRLGLATGPIVELGALDALLGNKLMAAAAVLSKEENKNMRVLDVRSPDFPLVTPVSTTTTTAPATATAASSEG